MAQGKGRDLLDSSIEACLCYSVNMVTEALSHHVYFCALEKLMQAPAPSNAPSHDIPLSNLLHCMPAPTNQVLRTTQLRTRVNHP
jgi:hypothetical protein